MNHVGLDWNGNIGKGSRFSKYFDTGLQINVCLYVCIPMYTHISCDSLLLTAAAYHEMANTFKESSKEFIEAECSLS